MAYNKGVNPDALPHHLQPEEAAAEIAKRKKARRRSNPPPANIRPTPPHKNDMPPGQGDRGGVSPYSYTPRQAMHRLESPPPPHNYGYGPRPPDTAATLGRPKIQNHPPPTPILPPQNAGESDLFPLFRAANVSGSGSLSEKELKSALVNSDYTPFHADTIRCLLRLFSSTPNKSHVNYEEFINLWAFLGAWRELFKQFDEDVSGSISLQEFVDALVAFGYRLSQHFTAVLYNFYKNQQTSVPGQPKPKGLSFDLFVQACISLKRMTDVFKSYDDDRDGYITLSFEEFLTEILRLRE